jgi:hypothetical protein
MFYMRQVPSLLTQEYIDALDVGVKWSLWQTIICRRKITTPIHQLKA